MNSLTLKFLNLNRFVYLNNKPRKKHSIHIRVRFYRLRFENCKYAVCKTKFKSFESIRPTVSENI